MVQLARQLVERQTGYDPKDVEDRYEMRLRALIEAKLKGEGVAAEDEAEPDRGNVIDLMAALKGASRTARPTRRRRRLRGHPVSRRLLLRRRPRPRRPSR